MSEVIDLREAALRFVQNKIDKKKDPNGPDRGTMTLFWKLIRYNPNKVALERDFVLVNEALHFLAGGTETLLVSPEGSMRSLVESMLMIFCVSDAEFKTKDLKLLYRYIETMGFILREQELESERRHL